MDLGLSFIPDELTHTTRPQAANRINPKIVLSIRVGKNVVSKAMPVLLEDLSITCKMRYVTDTHALADERLKLRLMTSDPHVKSIELSFIEKPAFDYVLKPIGGEMFGFDINNIPGLAASIRNRVHESLGPRMYDPNILTIDVQSLWSGGSLHSAVGVLKVRVIDARGLKSVKIAGGAPDPYVSFAFGGKHDQSPLARTRTVRNEANPRFEETHFLLVDDLADVLCMSVWDWNEYRPDNLLGLATRELASLADEPSQLGKIATIISGGKGRGTLRYDMAWFPVNQHLEPDGSIIQLLRPEVESLSGIARLTIHRGRDLGTNQHVNARVSVLLDGRAIHQTHIIKSSNQPIWDSSFEFFVQNKEDCVVMLRVDRAKDSEAILGMVSVKLNDLLKSAATDGWYHLQDGRSGRLQLSATWRPVDMTGGLTDILSYTPPIGILRLWLKCAQDVKNVEVSTGGKSDPYVRVLVNRDIQARTLVIDSTVYPEWDEIVYVPIHKLDDQVVLEVMDYQSFGTDRSLGSITLDMTELACEKEVEDGSYVSIGKRALAERIKLDKSGNWKGILYFEVDFKPTFAPAFPLFSQGEEDNSRNVMEMNRVENERSSGILVIQVISGRLARRSALEVMYDDGYWPAFRTSKAKTTRVTWNSVRVFALCAASFALTVDRRRLRQGTRTQSYLVTA